MTATLALLIVDDNPRMRATIRSVVSVLTTNVFECGDGESAIAMYDELLPDWLLMDVSMPPGLDGISATQRIRARHPNAKIAIVTDYGDPALQVSAAAAGASAFVTKDDLSLLLDILK